MRVLLAVLILCFWCHSSAADRYCGGVFEENELIIESPNYQDKSLSNVSCEFIFRGADCPTTFVLNFLDFYLENVYNCSTSGLVIDGNETICGIQDGSREYKSPNGLLKVVFYSSSHENNSKFKIFIQKSACYLGSASERVKRSILHDYCKTYDVPAPYGSSTAHQKLPSVYYDNPSNWPLINQQILMENFCCSAKYTEKNFIITSPHFPQIKNSPVDCVYHVYRANENICRLRLNFVFYWNGFQSNYGCQNGHLEIDGHSICGCRVGLKLISHFGKDYGSGPKIIRYKSNGLPSTAFNGFAIEVVQDECPTKYSPGQIQISNKKTIFPLHRYRRWIHQSNFKTNWPGQYTSHNGDGTSKHFYANQGPVYLNDAESADEETTYIDISRFNPFLPNGADNHKCKVWGVLQWGVLTKKALFRKIPKCTNSPVNNKCTEISTAQGCIKSPGYPFYYPNNLNLCYRFMKLPGYCSLKLTMLDFMLQDSYQCSKDFLLLTNSHKFCGARLYNTFSHLSFSNGIFEDMLFVTDGAFSCRGFKVWFEQVPCETPTTSTFPTPPITYPTASTTPTITTHPTRTFPTTTTTESTTTPAITRPTTTPMPPITTTETAITSTTSAVPEICYKEYRQRGFIIEHYGFENNICTFSVFKSSPDVCILNLQFIIFDIPCEEEYLVINGNRYCGRTNSADIEFNSESIPIVYYREPTYNPLNLRLQIIGTQETDCVPDPEVIPEKLEDEGKQYETEVIDDEIKGYNIIIKNLNEKMCGLVIKAYSYNDDMERNMCSMLKNVEDKSNCIAFPDHSIYTPYVDGKIILVVATIEIYENMQLKEVRCGGEDISKTEGRVAHNY